MVTPKQCRDVLQGGAEHAVLQRLPLRDQYYMEPEGEIFLVEINNVA